MTVYFIKGGNPTNLCAKSRYPVRVRP